MATCGEVLVRILEGYGVDTAFGIPRVHTVELYRGLPNTQIRHITPRHEQGAGFMADGYAITLQSSRSNAFPFTTIGLAIIRSSR